MKKNIDLCFEKANSITDLCDRLEWAWFLIESWLLKKLIIERKDNNTVRYELYLNEMRTFFRKKKSLFLLLQKYWLFVTK